MLLLTLRLDAEGRVAAAISCQLPACPSPAGGSASGNTLPCCRTHFPLHHLDVRQVGFLGLHEAGHGRSTVGLTRARGSTLLIGPLDPYGLIGLAAAVRPLEHALRAGHSDLRVWLARDHPAHLRVMPDILRTEWEGTRDTRVMIGNGCPSASWCGLCVVGR